MQTTRQSGLFCINKRKKQTKREEVRKRKEHKERERLEGNNYEINK